MNQNFSVDEMLGKEVQDIVTGVKGICIGKVTWLFGCNQYSIQPQSDCDGVVKESLIVDEGRLKVISNGIRPEEVQASSGKTGGCSSLGRRI